MIIDKYSEMLMKVENKFDTYKKDLDFIIQQVSSKIKRSVVVKGAVANFTPFYIERLGDKLTGKIIEKPVESDDCRRYHYDDKDRIIMVEKYSVFLKKFRIEEIYLYNDWTEKLLLSSEVLIRLFVFDNPFDKTNMCLSYAGRNGFEVEEFVYEENRLKEIHIGRKEGDYKDTFIYESKELIMIEHTWPSGKKGIIYTTKKPNFNKMKQDVYSQLKVKIEKYESEFCSFGIEGFLDQTRPEFYICFESSKTPTDLLAEWNTEMIAVPVYDYQFDSEQLGKCITMISEIIVELVNEGVLKDKEIYFHQNQVAVTENYPRAKSVFRKAQIVVK